MFKLPTTMKLSMTHMLLGIVVVLALGAMMGIGIHEGMEGMSSKPSKECKCECDCKKCKGEEKHPPCPPCGRCPEPSFTCKKVPNYASSATEGILPQPVLNDFSTFGQ